MKQKVSVIFGKTAFTVVVGIETEILLSVWQIAIAYRGSGREEETAWKTASERYR